MNTAKCPVHPLFASTEAEIRPLLGAQALSPDEVTRLRKQVKSLSIRSQLEECAGCRAQAGELGRVVADLADRLEEGDRANATLPRIPA